MNQFKEFFQWLLDSIKIWVIVQPWESAVRVRFGSRIKTFSGGIFFRLPYFDSVYVQENRLRVAETSIQTVTSIDSHSVTIDCSIGYLVDDIYKLYNSIYEPETTICNIAKSNISNYISNKYISDLNSKDLESFVLNELKTLDYGLKFEYFKVQNFAIVKTFRLIQDQSWSYEKNDMNIKR